MDVTPQLFSAKVMHKRLFPSVNQFMYRVYYLALPLSQLNQIDCLAINQRGVMAFREKDYGPRDGSSLAKWINDILAAYELIDEVNEILLITMPRIFGYSFNPVSFYICLDRAGHIRAVLAEVHNTFGEAHSYLCLHEDHRPIQPDDWLQAEKVFHVSPFLPREGHYRFRFANQEPRLGIWIDYYDAQGKKQLVTSLTGQLAPMTADALRRAFWSHPLVTIKTIALIHWQAMKLFSKGIHYIIKPLQREPRLTKVSKVN